MDIEPTTMIPPEIIEETTDAFKRTNAPTQVRNAAAVPHENAVPVSPLLGDVKSIFPTTVKKPIDASQYPQIHPEFLDRLNQSISDLKFDVNKQRVAFREVEEIVEKTDVDFERRDELKSLWSEIWKVRQTTI